MVKFEISSTYLCTSDFGHNHPKIYAPRSENNYNKLLNSEQKLCMVIEEPLKHLHSYIQVTNKLCNFKNKLMLVIKEPLKPLY